jgi:hypothetical protein
MGNIIGAIGEIYEATLYNFGIASQSDDKLMGYGELPDEWAVQTG